MGSRRKLSLHIGTHKTGTTSFQQFLGLIERSLGDADCALFESGLRLKDQLGQNACGWAPELALLALRSDLQFPLRDVWEARADSSRDQFCIRCASEFDRPESHLIASQEDLSFIRNPDEVRTIAELAEKSGREVFIFLIRRRPGNWLRSWRYQLDQMQYPEFSLDSSSVSYTARDSWRLDRDGLEKSFVTWFGEQRVRVLHYEDSLRSSGSIIPDLAAAIGIPQAIGHWGEPPWSNSRRAGARSEKFIRSWMPRAWRLRSKLLYTIHSGSHKRLSWSSAAKCRRQFLQRAQ